MDGRLYEYRRALFGGVLALVFAPVLASAVVGWERATAVLGLLAAVFALLLVLKAASAFLAILVRSVL
ncbi:MULTISPECIES: hypothetical protein [Halorussus]|uniref:hypothetical protein n=1 Tax=Halorussus TaxID=1070314 RepID=UPI000E21839E|nr:MULTISPECIES: hypothetical protein [Halorussus]NHN60883.1 hypothetical protein [Halorussus sp. JP-T4]